MHDTSNHMRPVPVVPAADDRHRRVQRQFFEVTDNAVIAAIPLPEAHNRFAIVIGSAERLTAKWQLGFAVQSSENPQKWVGGLGDEVNIGELLLTVSSCPPGPKHVFGKLSDFAGTGTYTAEVISWFEL